MHCEWDTCDVVNYLATVRVRAHAEARHRVRVGGMVKVRVDTSRLTSCSFWNSSGAKYWVHPSAEPAAMRRLEASLERMA